MKIKINNVTCKELYESGLTDNQILLYIRFAGSNEVFEVGKATDTFFILKDTYDKNDDDFEVLKSLCTVIEEPKKVCQRCRECDEDCEPQDYRPKLKDIDMNAWYKVKDSLEDEWGTGVSKITGYDGGSRMPYLAGCTWKYIRKATEQEINEIDN